MIFRVLFLILRAVRRQLVQYCVLLLMRVISGGVRSLQVDILLRDVTARIFPLFLTLGAADVGFLYQCLSEVSTITYILYIRIKSIVTSHSKRIRVVTFRVLLYSPCRVTLYLWHVYWVLFMYRQVGYLNVAEFRQYLILHVRWLTLHMRLLLFELILLSELINLCRLMCGVRRPLNVLLLLAF